MSGEHKLKEGDEIIITQESRNNAELLFFSNRCQVYKACAADFEDTKASVMGDYIPSKLGFDEGESAIFMAVVEKFTGFMLFFYENGKAAKVFCFDGRRTDGNTRGIVIENGRKVLK